MSPELQELYDRLAPPNGTAFITLERDVLRTILRKLAIFEAVFGTFEHHAARLAEHEQNRETCKEHGHVPDMASTFRSGNNLNCHHCKRCGEVVKGK